MIYHWNQILLLLKLQIDMMNIPALLLGWGAIAVLSFLFFQGEKHRNGKQITAFLLYCWFIIGLTLLRRSGSEGKESVNLYFHFSAILFWIKTGNPQILYMLINLLLFVPFGYLLRHLLHPGKKSLFVGICGFLCSAVIEVLQLLFGLGILELIDMIANTAGTLLGAVIFGFFVGREKGNKYGYECTGKEDGLSQ